MEPYSWGSFRPPLYCSFSGIIARMSFPTTNTFIHLHVPRPRHRCCLNLGTQVPFYAITRHPRLLIQITSQIWLGASAWSCQGLRGVDNGRDLMLQGGIIFPKGSSLQEQRQTSAHPSIQATQAPGAPLQQGMRPALRIDE